MRKYQTNKKKDTTEIYFNVVKNHGIIGMKIICIREVESIGILMR
jgi:hypothetical protein